MAELGIAATLDRLSKVIAANPDKARVRFTPARALLLDGLKCRLTGSNGEQMDTDMPPAMGGGGSGTNPGWLFRASLAACCSTVIAMRAARLGITLRELEVSVESDSDSRGILGLDDAISVGYSAIRTEIRIGATDATPQQLHELVQWAIGHSPVCCTVRDAPANTLSVAVT
jgi:uncharacterized OsmC-like protein